MSTKEVVKKGLETLGSASLSVGKHLIGSKPKFRIAKPKMYNPDSSVDKTKMGMYIPSKMRKLNTTKGLRKPRLF